MTRRGPKYNPAAMTDQPTVSVIVLGWNGRQYVDPCLTSLPAQDFDRPYEVLFVDNGSTDGTADLAERHAGVRVHRLDRNYGYCLGNNKGFELAGGGGSVFDPDMFAYAEDMALALRIRNAGYRTVVATGAVLYHDHTLQDQVSLRSFVKTVRIIRNRLLALWKCSSWPEFLALATITLAGAPLHSSQFGLPLSKKMLYFLLLIPPPGGPPAGAGPALPPAPAGWPTSTSTRRSATPTWASSASWRPRRGSCWTSALGAAASCARRAPAVCRRGRWIWSPTLLTSGGATAAPAPWAPRPARPSPTAASTS